MTTSPISKCRILVIEDEYFLAAEMHEGLVNAGATVIGPVSSLSEALRLIEGTAKIDGAVLDVNLRGEAAYPAAEMLEERKVPTLFVSGYDPKVIPPRFRNTPHCEKPVAVQQVIDTLVKTMRQT